MSATLIIDLQGWWHPGGGRGAGAVADAVAHRDSHGLPVLPGRHLKGLLREACLHAEAFGWPGFEHLADTLFGERTEDTDPGQVPKPGCLRIGDATLEPALHEWLGSEQGKHLQPHLFQVLHATAIDHDSGTAVNQSLRGIEVVVPLKLQASITPIPGQQPPAGWQQRLEEILPLIEAVGAYRSRGLGRAVLTLAQQNKEAAA